jgi:hypothetical protein
MGLYVPSETERCFKECFIIRFRCWRIVNHVLALLSTDQCSVSSLGAKARSCGLIASTLRLMNFRCPRANGSAHHDLERIVRQRPLQILVALQLSTKPAVIQR